MQLLSINGKRRKEMNKNEDNGISSLNGMSLQLKCI